MPPQTQSDQAYPERARWDDTRVGEAQTQPLHERGLAPAAPRPPVSRRSILRGAAGVSVVGIAAAGGAGAVVAATRQSAPQTLMPASRPVAMAPLVDKTFTPDAAAGRVADGLTMASVPAGYLSEFPYLGVPYSGFSTPAA